MTSTTREGNAPVTITIDPDAVLRAYQFEGYDQDGEPQSSGPLINAVHDAVADKVYRDIKDEVIKLVTTTARDVIEEEVRNIVTDALDGEVTPTSQFGVRGKPKQLREMIADEVKGWFHGTGGSYGSGQRGTKLDKWVTDAVDRAVTSDLKALVAEERAKVVERVRSVAAEQIAKEVTKR